MSKVRINDLARELEVKSRAILDTLPLVGVTEKKTHSSSLEEHEAQKVRVYIRSSAEGSSSPGKSSSRASRGEEEIKTKIDLSNISRPGDVLRAITQKKEAAAPPAAPRPAAQAPADKPAAAPPAGEPSNHGCATTGQARNAFSNGYGECVPDYSSNFHASCRHAPTPIGARSRNAGTSGYAASRGASAFRRSANCFRIRSSPDCESGASSCYASTRAAHDRSTNGPQTRLQSSIAARSASGSAGSSNRRHNATRSRASRTRPAYLPAPSASCGRSSRCAASAAASW